MTQEATFYLQLADSSYIEAFLKSLVNQDFDKTKTHLYVTSDAASLSDSRILQEFIEAANSQYRNVVIDGSLGAQARQRSVAYAIDNRTSYVSIDQNIVLHPRALARLSNLNLEVVAPMLNSGGVYSNFHAYVTDNGYYKEGENYWNILNRELRGTFQVPVVNGCYVVRKDIVPQLCYDDGSRRAEYVMLSSRLRQALIPQYIDNTFDYGIILDNSNKSPSEIQHADSLNNKNFLLRLSEKGKKGIVCDADWLEGYVINEHYYLLKLLNEKYGWDIINCRRLSPFTRHGVDDLSSYDVLLAAYHTQSQIPLEMINALKIYKMDDLENDPYYTRIAKYHIANSNIVISPYEYLFRNYYQHDDVVWIPYSCAI